MVRRLVSILLITAAAAFAGVCPARADGAVLIGAVLTLSGDEARGGQEALIGLERAVKALNGQGGIEIAGVVVPVRLEVFDDRGSDRRAAALAEVLAARKGAAAVISGSRPSASLAIAPAGAAWQVPMVDIVGLPGAGQVGAMPFAFSILPSLEDRWMPALAFAILVRRAQGREPDEVPFALVAADPILHETALRVGASWGLTPTDNAGANGITLVLGDPGSWQTGAGGIKIVPACDAARRLRELNPTGAILCTALWRRDAEVSLSETALTAEIAVLTVAQAIARGRSAYGPVVRDVMMLLDIETPAGPIRFGADGRNAALATRLYAVEASGLYEVDPTDPSSLWANAP